MDWEIAGWEISFCSEDCICSEFLGLYYKWMVSLPEVENELLCRTSQTNWSPSETLGWSNWIFCTGNFPFIMVSGGQIWDMELSWEGFCKVVLGMLMFGCSSFPCPSRTVALTRTGIVCVCVWELRSTNNTTCNTYAPNTTNSYNNFHTSKTCRRLGYSSSTAQAPVAYTNSGYCLPTSQPNSPKTTTPPLPRAFPSFLTPAPSQPPRWP